MGRVGLLLAFILITVMANQVEGKRGGAQSYSGTRSAASSRGVRRTTKHKTARSFTPKQKSTMKKAAIGGVGAYIGYKASSKMKKAFKGHSWRHGHNP